MPKHGFHGVPPTQDLETGPALATADSPASAVLLGTGRRLHGQQQQIVSVNAVERRGETMVRASRRAFGPASVERSAARRLPSACAIISRCCLASLTAVLRFMNITS